MKFMNMYTCMHVASGDLLGDYERIAISTKTQHSPKFSN